MDIHFSWLLGIHREQNEKLVGAWVKKCGEIWNNCPRGWERAYSESWKLWDLRWGWRHWILMALIFNVVEFPPTGLSSLGVGREKSNDGVQERSELVWQVWQKHTGFSELKLMRDVKIMSFKGQTCGDRSGDKKEGWWEESQEVEGFEISLTLKIRRGRRNHLRVLER